MNPPLTKQVPPLLKKRMQGKTRFNFKLAPDREMLAELKRLTAASIKDWRRRK
jgi:hypothetical protein